MEALFLRTECWTIGPNPALGSNLAWTTLKVSWLLFGILLFDENPRIYSRQIVEISKNIVACQGGEVSSKTRRHGADKTRR